MPQVGPTLSAEQLTEVRAAVGHMLNEDGSPAPVDEVNTVLMNYLRNIVRERLVLAAGKVAEKTKLVELEAEGW